MSIYVILLCIVVFLIIINSKKQNKNIEYISPEMEKAIGQPFKMTIQDVFTIKGRGIVVTGMIESGIIKIGDNVELVDYNGTKNAVVTGIEKFRKVLNEARAGENVGILLKDINNTEVKRGQVLAKPGSIRYN